MLVSEREKKADKINRKASTVSSTYSGNSSKGKRLYAKRKGENKIQITRLTHCCAPALWAEQWLSGICKVLQRAHIQRFFHLVPPRGGHQRPMRLGAPPVPAFSASAGTSTTEQIARVDLLLLFVMALGGHTSLSRMEPERRRTSCDCPNFTECASGIIRSPFPNTLAPQNYFQHEFAAKIGEQQDNKSGKRPTDGDTSPPAIKLATRQQSSEYTP